VGVVFLAAGVLLGGIWADYSWGRFWGWDPKETWSLIALMIYICILHGKYVGWFKDFNFTLMAGVGFLFILMAWFGVNYILATGLHSYGFSSGGSLFLLTIFTVQLIILGSALLLHLKIEKASTQVSSQ
jgi:cytochrome c biogenesis factor